MEFTEQLIIILISQVPLAIYSIWNGVKRNKPEIRKTEADEEAALSEAVQGAGKTLDGAWKRIAELEAWKQQADVKMHQLEDELKRWRNYAARLIKQMREVAPDVEPVGQPCGATRRNPRLADACPAAGQTADRLGHTAQQP